MNTINRRSFIQRSALAAAALSIAPSRSLSAEATEKVKLGLIGCGWWGMVVVEAAFKAGGVEVLAMCDVDSDNLEKSTARVATLQGQRPKTFKNYEDLLKVEGLQAVIIASPPHWHALQFIAALDRGLDIYCEKPLAYDIREGQAMVAAAQKAGKIVQIGFQRRQSPAIRQVRDYIQEGRPGRIIQVEAQINYRADMRNATPQDPPPALDWDLWCGPAPRLPYSPNIGHFAWRFEKEYGHGHMVDWGIHLIDAARWILGESAPKSVQAAGGNYHFKQITTPDVLTAHFEFEKCPVVWRHRMFGAAEYTPDVSNGIFFYGENETVFVSDNRWVVIPKARGQERKVNDARADVSTAHIAAFLTAVRTRTEPEPLCTTADAHLSTSAVKLAMIAYETGSKVTWNATTSQIENNPAAAQLLKREYRSPWKHPYQAPS